MVVAVYGSVQWSTMIVCNATPYSNIHYLQTLSWFFSTTYNHGVPLYTIISGTCQDYRMVYTIYRLSQDGTPSYIIACLLSLKWCFI